jgi:hypothetical protein
MRSPLGALVPLLALVTLVVVAPACKGKKEISFEILLPSSVVEETVWFEVGAYRDASCGAVGPMLMNGVPDSASARVAFCRPGSRESCRAEAPRLGDLDTGKYAFAAVAKAENCGVLATGCVEVDVGDADNVTISMTATESPSGACGTGAVCEAARCVPANDNKNPSVGAECSLELLGAGPLANPVGGAGTTVSAPAIATTPSGFVIVYREIDPNGTNARVTVLPIDPAGGALDPTRPLLKGRCANSDETDGVGLVMNGADGQIVLARSACGATPGLELLSFKTKPEVSIDTNFVISPSPAGQKLTLSGAHVAARGPGGGIIVFNEDGANKVSTIHPLPDAGVRLPSGTFGGTANMTGAWVAASDKVLAVLSGGPPQGTPVVDAGVDGGPDASTEPPPEDTSPQLSLILVPVATPLGQFDVIAGTPRPPITFPGIWGAVAALGTRVIVMSDGGGPERSVSYRAFDLDRPPSGDSSGFAIEGAGTVTTGDITMVGDKAYLAALKPGGVSLHVFASVATTPRPIRDVIFGKQPRIPSVAAVRDTGRVAVAANATRVAVVWTTAKALTNNDSTGGYAVFACTQ